MIDISKTDDLTFIIRFDPQIAQTLTDIADRGSVEDLLTFILYDALICANHYTHPDYDLDGDIPF